jgi:hypothetical protein
MIVLEAIVIYNVWTALTPLHPPPSSSQLQSMYSTNYNNKNNTT